MRKTAGLANSIRKFLLTTLFVIGSTPLYAADCPLPDFAVPQPELIVDWYARYIEPSRAFAGFPVEPRPTKEAVEALVGPLDDFHRRSSSESLFFEPLVKQITNAYAGAGDFKGLTTASAEKIYRNGTGTSLDFGALCIDTRRDRFPDDTFAITLSGVNQYNCKHVTLRGLVFTGTLVNGTINGDCRADHLYRKMLFVPVLAGTNTVTFICSKDAGGCAGR